jgi:hypothetical protein
MVEQVEGIEGWKNRNLADRSVDPTGSTRIVNTKTLRG